LRPKRRPLVHRQHAYGFEQIAFSAAVSADEDVDAPQLDLDPFDRFEGLDGDFCDNNK
jgi:hypothetical protein